jgi:hypothetical protein
MKIQVVAFISNNGYLLLRPEYKTNSDIGFGKYSFGTLQEQADFILHKESSLISLLEERRQCSETNYLVETTSDTLDLIKGLFLYRLVDELILYRIPCPEKHSFHWQDLVSISDWVLVKETSKKNGFYYLIYHIIK